MISTAENIHKVPKAIEIAKRSSLPKWASGLFRSRASFQITRAIEDWLDQSGITDFMWTKYQHPNYLLSIKHHVRGQAIHLMVDYEADQSLGLFAYMPFLYQDKHRAEALRAINAANLEIRYGNFELLSSEPRLRFSLSVGVHGLMLSSTYIEHMFGCVEYACDQCLGDLMTVSWKPSVFGSTESSS